ncbi:hypothetical protein OJ996_02145 [Luteolibacter sp. GHJ8]|uniref:F5/8 type C domain-containing protein n=1 Tax=Luteolibacter rhizosphaerae TaxID=2989719 RepID=A0ABT3FXP7_9BACT|nr:hypothetical protein [Luteolibacter rhizosphaerae]MCW1912356.1 hypothetical protein [Luteolibacter rhizosphaerae]
MSHAEVINAAGGARATASSYREGRGAGKVVDGVVDDTSRWLAAESDPAPWLEIELPQATDIVAVDLFSGWEGGDALADFDLALESGGRWIAPPEGKVRGNQDPALRISIKLPGVTRLKVSLIHAGAARIREIALPRELLAPPGAGLSGEMLGLRGIALDTHQVALNQVGFEGGRPKRFTAPLSADGTAFVMRRHGGDAAVVHEGKVHGGIGDFSEYREAGEYVIELSGGSLKSGFSDPFLIGPDLMQDLFWQPAVDFLIDSRSVAGTHPSAYGGCPWRDGTYYDAILPALVMLYRADAKRVEGMPRQIDWAADKKRILDPAFKFDAKNPCSEGVMEAVRKYYTELEPPAADAPDVVKLIHWGAGYYLCNPATKDPSDDPDPRQIHSQTVEQVSYVVWAWPELKRWLPESFYEKCRSFCEENWSKSLEIDKWWDPATYLTEAQIHGKNPFGGLLHPYKGRHAPGHSIVPNLLMHEIAKRDGRPDPDRYLKVAVAQTAWIVEKIDWNDPRTTKGQRMSEHRTIPNLVWLLQKYPEQSPPGLKEKIAEWARVAAKRSENLWDFRRYDEERNWTIPKLNDVGNWASAPAVFLAASWALDDPVLKRRMQELASSHADAVFGRNPRLAATTAKQDGFTGIERTWPNVFQNDTCARLELCRGSIDSGPGTEMFPFNPQGGYRHAEGWVNYGAAWCMSLAYLEFDARRAESP